MQMTAQMMYMLVSLFYILYVVLSLLLVIVIWCSSACSHFDSQDDKSGRAVVTNNGLRNRSVSTQKAVSLPTSPHDYEAEISETSDNCDFISKEKMVFAWNRVLQSSPFNKPLLPFQEWNIDFSELTIGTRVGIGKSTWTYPDKFTVEYLLIHILLFLKCTSPILVLLHLCSFHWHVLLLLLWYDLADMYSKSYAQRKVKVWFD